MDIVDNCNLRCPFCLYDYAAVRTTHFMTEDTIDAALRFLPYTPDGNFWFSCLHEPTLHPYLTRYIDKVPLHYRQNLPGFRKHNLVVDVLAGSVGIPNPAGCMVYAELIHQTFVGRNGR